MTPALHLIELSTGVRPNDAEQGDPAGMPVVLLHGIPDSWCSFEPVTAHLPAALRVLGPALVDRGTFSPREDHRKAPERFARDVADLATQVDATAPAPAPAPAPGQP